MRQQRGNILFLILLAVVLFAALSYAVTQSMRGGGKDGDSENAKLLASEILDYSNLVYSTILRARMVHNIQDYGLDVSGDYIIASTSNSTCINSDCRIFNNAGTSGLMASRPLNESSSTASLDIQRNVLFSIVDIKNVGTSLPELILSYAFINSDVCENI